MGHLPSRGAVLPGVRHPVQGRLRRASLRTRVLVGVFRGLLLHRGRVPQLRHRVLGGVGDDQRAGVGAVAHCDELPQDLVPHRRGGVRARGSRDQGAGGYAEVFVRTRRVQRGGEVRRERGCERAEAVQAPPHLPAGQAAAAVPRVAAAASVPEPAHLLPLVHQRRARQRAGHSYRALDGVHLRHEL